MRGSRTPGHHRSHGGSSWSPGCTAGNNAGETAVAESLRERANDAIRGEYYARISCIHDKMSKDETAAAIDTLRSLPKEFPERKLEIALRLRAPRGFGEEHYQAGPPVQEYGRIGHEQPS
jgi:hypothetical protein